MSDLITQEEIQLLEACQSNEDWREACDTIKNARQDSSGDPTYPSDWWKTVKLSGMMDRISARWGEIS